MATEKLDNIQLNPIMESLEQLRTVVKDKCRSEGEIKEIVGKCENVLTKFVEAENAFNAKQAANDQYKVELEAKLVALETQMCRIPGNTKEAMVNKERTEALYKWLRFGKDCYSESYMGECKAAMIARDPSIDVKNVFTRVEQKLMRTDVNTLGGFLAPEDFRLEILKLITETSPVRQVARIITTSRGEVVIPKRRTLVKTKFVGEAGKKEKSQSTYGEERIKLNKMTAVVEATFEMLTDSAFNIEEQIQLDVTESFAQEEGLAFVRGNAVNEPEGFMTDTQIPFIKSDLATTIQGDNLIDLTGELKSGQNAIFGMNRRTLAVVRRLKDTTDAYLFALNIGLASGLGSTIAGAPFREFIDMDDVAAGTEPIIYGDFRRGYTIIDGVNLSVIRDDFTFSDECIIRFVWARQTGGQVVLEDAFVKLRVEV